MASRKCIFPCVCTTDPLQNYLWHMVQGYGSQKVHFSVWLYHWSSSELLVTHGAGTWFPESALSSVFAPLIHFKTTCDTWCRDMAPRKCTFPCVCTIDPLQNYLWQMVQVYGFQKVHFFVFLHHGPSSELLVTLGNGIWHPDSALFRVFAPLILFRTTCDTWCRDMASRKCTLLWVCIIDPLQNYLWHMIQGYGFQKVHFSVCLHHWSSSELLVEHGAHSVCLWPICVLVVPYQMNGQTASQQNLVHNNFLVQNVKWRHFALIFVSGWKALWWAYFETCCWNVAEHCIKWSVEEREKRCLLCMLSSPKTSCNSTLSRREDFTLWFQLWS